MSNITLKVNGMAHTVDVDPSTPLLYILRNDLGLQGPRFGCGLGQCGACAVIINGAAVRSCITPCSAVKSEVTTLEGLAVGGTLHPVQRAWIEEQVPQCGYCQPGFIMAAAALLRERPKPTDREIDEALTNICRCGTYSAIRRALHRAAAILGGAQ
jgi:aerobic-type carbon monoxide dehydrogenase small subunit (CoxS/CutS family)